MAHKSSMSKKYKLQNRKKTFRKTFRKTIRKTRNRRKIRTKTKRQNNRVKRIKLNKKSRKQKGGGFNIEETRKLKNALRPFQFEEDEINTLFNRFNKYSNILSDNLNNTLNNLNEVFVNTTFTLEQKRQEIRNYITELEEQTNVDLLNETNKSGDSEESIYSGEDEDEDEDEDDDMNSEISGIEIPDDEIHEMHDI